MATEEPKYDILLKSGEYELRQYNPMIVAEVLVEGDLDKATNQGFRLIADYIFGNNMSQSGDSAKIAMTAPVTVEPKSETIAMTVPVTIGEQSGLWRVQFVMPSQYTMENLPKPKNPKVILRKVAPRNVAVLSFSGFAGAEKVRNKNQELMAWMNVRQLKSIGVPELARYNPPWTLPFLRRNEVMVGYE